MTTKTCINALILLIICAFGCGKTKPGWKTIDMGEYLIDVPEDFNLKFEKGIDSQTGSLKGKGFALFYDYGPYGDTLVMTKQEFLRKGFWKDDAIMRFLNYEMRTHVEWVKTKVKWFRPCTDSDSSFASGCDLMASCVYLQYQFMLPVYIPQEIKNHVVNIDTLDGYYRRLVSPKQGVKGIIGVYMRKSKVDRSPGVLYNSMVIGASNLNAQQQAVAWEIVKSLRAKPED